MLRHPHWEWTVFSLCRADDRDRAPKFARVCDALRSAPLISDLDDGAPLAEIDAPREIGGRLREVLGERRWDVCLTHGAGGEYGHPRHVQVHAQVLRAAAMGWLAVGEVWAYACVCDPRTGHCRPDPAADALLALTPAELSEKKRLVRDVYGYAEDSFEVTACITPEAFRRCPPMQGTQS